MTEEGCIESRTEQNLAMTSLHSVDNLHNKVGRIFSEQLRATRYPNPQLVKGKIFYIKIEYILN